MRFHKAHGAGNDFVVIPDWADALELGAPLVRALCDRRHGIGGDGVLRIVAGGDLADAVMDYRNADGSVAEMCGNGVRVVAKHVVDRGLVEPDAAGRLRIETRAGVREVTVDRAPSGEVVRATVDMGPADLDPATIPFDHDGDRAIAVPVEVDGGAVDVTAVSMGNPHAVLVVDDVEAVVVERIGPALETHERFPKRTNVEFVQVLSRGEVRVRVWERGVGETAACGSGACAVTVALQELGQAGEVVTQHWRGGTLEARRADGGHVLLTGPAVVVASGELDPTWLEEHS